MLSFLVVLLKLLSSFFYHQMINYKLVKLVIFTGILLIIKSSLLFEMITDLMLVFLLMIMLLLLVKFMNLSVHKL